MNKTRWTIVVVFLLVGGAAFWMTGAREKAVHLEVVFEDDSTLEDLPPEIVEWLNTPPFEDVGKEFLMEGCGVLFEYKPEQTALLTVEGITIVKEDGSPGIELGVSRKLSLQTIYASYKLCDFSTIIIAGNPSVCALAMQFPTGPLYLQYVSDGENLWIKLDDVHPMAEPRTRRIDNRRA